MASKIHAFAATLALLSSAWAQSVDGPRYNNPTAGPPSSYFTAAASIPVAALQTAAAKASTAAKDATYAVNRDHGAAKATIFSDWSNFDEGAAFVWVADMDVDCDGIDYQCRGNQDGQPQTNFGALAAYQVPWIVLPDDFATTYSKDLPGNNIAAVICDGKMFYGIYGDSNGDAPEVIGEASWLMARTCFPNDNLNGNSGHAGVDVTYIVFTGEDAVLPSSALNENYITNFSTLRSMGNQLMNALLKNLNLFQGRSTVTPTPSPSSWTTIRSTPSLTPSPTSTPLRTTSSSNVGSCSWPGHCEGAPCSSYNDCSDYLVCISGKCAH